MVESIVVVLTIKATASVTKWRSLSKESYIPKPKLTATSKSVCLTNYYSQLGYKLITKWSSAV